MKSKLKSFTLSELIVTMIITLIVVGIAFTVLNFVSKNVTTIGSNYASRTGLGFFEQCIWQDFNKSNKISYDPDVRRLLITSQTDTITYSFEDNYLLRNTDTIKPAATVNKVYFQGIGTSRGTIDAISLTAVGIKPDYTIFVYKRNDGTNFINQDGF